MDFQFDSTVDGKAVKIASMIDEPTRLSLMNIMERSISAQRLVEEIGKTFALPRREAKPCNGCVRA